MMIKIVLGAAGLFFVGALYCCLVVASDADDEMEKWLYERGDILEDQKKDV